MKLSVFMEVLMLYTMTDPCVMEVTNLSTIKIHGDGLVEPPLCVVGRFDRLGNPAREMHWNHPGLCLQFGIQSVWFYVCTMATRQR